MRVASFLLATTLALTSFTVSAETININKANAAAFQYYLAGVGEVKSKSIVKYRTSHKKFKTVDEIKDVKGIGSVIFNKIKSNLSLTRGVISAPAKISKKSVSSKRKTIKSKKVSK